MRRSIVAGIIVGTLVIMALFIHSLPDFDMFRRDHMVTSGVDNESYTVQEEYENKYHAADILAEINQMYVRVITHLKRNCMSGPYARQIEFLSSNYNPSVLGEHIPTNLKYTSFVSQKGKKIRLCLRTPGNRNVFHDTNTLHFVALHELTHMMVQSYGHDDEFWTTFAYVLREAASLGEVKLIDYSQHPLWYCGIPIQSSPVFSY